MIVAKHKDTGVVVNEGDKLKDFRGDEWTYCSANQRGRNRVYVKREGIKNEQEFFPSVFDLILDEIDAG